MSLELILDILLSAIVLAVYHSDCQQQPSLVYSCDSSEMPIFGHQEYYIRQVSPENYESSLASHLITQDDKWIDDPMDATPELDDLTLGELFAAADAIIPMDAEVAAELQAIDEEIDLLLPVRTKVATVVQLRTLIEGAPELFSARMAKGRKADLAGAVLLTFGRYGIFQYLLDSTTYLISDDKQSVLVLLK